MLLSVYFFNTVWLLVDALKDYDLEPTVTKLCSVLERLMQEKEDSIAKRTAFSKYKAAPPGSDERQALRLAYLELAGIHKDWTSTEEIPYTQM